MFFPALKARNSKVNGLIWPEFELVRDFMPVQIMCKSHKDPIKTKTDYAPDKVKYGVFPHSRANNSERKCPIWPEFKLVQDFMPVLVTRKFDKDLIKNECASLETPFSHYNYMGNFFDAQGHLTPKGVVRPGQNSNSFEILCLSSLCASLMKIWSKLKAWTWSHCFPHYVNGPFLLPWKPEFSSNLSQKLMQLFPYPSLKVWTDDRQMADHWYTINSPCKPSAHLS